MDSASDANVTHEHPGRYRIKATLGKGSQGSVFIAADTHLGRDVAVKFPAPAAGPAATSRFLREARIAAQLEHPNIVPVYEVARRPDGTIYCVQKLVRPEASAANTMRDALRETKTLTARLKLLNAFVDVCHGVAYAHSRGVLHRDLKPENVVLGRFGETIVLDWGLARAEGGLYANSSDPKDSGAFVLPPDNLSTLEGQAYGTPAYMSPEQARGETAIDARTDIWSLGAMLFELLTGRLPFSGGSALETVALVRDGPVPRARAVAADAPAELSAIVDRALQRDPAKRYTSANALADDVIAWQNGHRVGVYEYGPLELIKLFVSRNRVATLVGVLSLLAVLGAATIATQKYFEARRALSAALLEKARDAERALQWDKAAQLYGQALAQDDNDETRWGVRLIGSRNPPPLERLVGQPGPSRALAFSPDGKTLAVGASDGTVYLWDPKVKSRVGTVKAHVRDITSVSFSTDGLWLATSSEDGSARVFATDGWREEAPLAIGLKDSVNAVAFSPKGDAIAIASEDGRVSVLSWPGRVPGYVNELPARDGPPPPMYAVAWSSTGLLAWGNWAGDLAVVELDGALRRVSERKFLGHLRAVLSLDFSPDSHELVSAGRDGSVRVWSVADGIVVHNFEGHTQKVYAVRLAPDGVQLATGSTDRTLRLWDRLMRQPNVGASFNDGEDLHAVAWSADGKRLAWSGTSGDVRIRDVPPQSGFGGAKNQGRTFVVAPSPDGRWLVTSRTRGLDVWNTATHALVGSLPAGDLVIQDATFLGNDRVAWTCEPLEVCLAQRDGSGAITRFAMPDNAYSLAAAADGAWVAVATVSGLVRMFDGRTGAVKWDARQHTSVVYSLARSPDGTKLASASYDKTIRLWSTSDGRELKVLKGHTHGVRRVAFSPDGQTLASASWDTTVRLWDVETGALKAVGARHEDHVFGLSWAPSGRWLATGAWDGTIRIWDSKTARELGRAVADVDRVFALAVDPAETGIWYSGFDVHRLDFHLVDR